MIVIYCLSYSLSTCWLTVTVPSGAYWNFQGGGGDGWGKHVRAPKIKETISFHPKIWVLFHNYV